MIVLSVDWGKERAKRAVCKADRGQRGAGSRWRFLRQPPPATGWSLPSLIDLALTLRRDSRLPVLVGIDAVLGVPSAYASKSGHTSFLDVVRSLDLSERAAESGSADEWSVDRPFFRVPPGRGALHAFFDAAGGKDVLLRPIDRMTGAKSVFILSGIPGTVGSGSRALWQELQPMLDDPDRAFGIWPFEGTVDEIADSRGVVLAELYPRVAYGLALADRLPCRPLAIAKTKQAARTLALAHLEGSAWARRALPDLPDLDRARDNEDDFDALFAGLAVARLIDEKRPLESRLQLSSAIEGGILGTNELDLERRRQPRKPRRRSGKPVPSPARSTARPKGLPCPIPGCTKVFTVGRWGWDGHVGSPPIHPDWHPEVLEPEQRRRLFRTEFEDWF